MLEKVRIKPDDVCIGKALPWPVYDIEEALLLQENTIIASDKQLQILLEKGVYRGLTQQETIDLKKEQTPPAQKKKTVAENIFDGKKLTAQALEKLLKGLIAGEHVNASETISDITKQIKASCQQDANATLAALHLSDEFSYSVLHPLHTATLCELLMQRLNFTDEQASTVLSAALTMNLGMYQLQEELFTQINPLTEEQTQAIHAHPKHSATILKAAGITDTNWLTIVEQHHERIDGEGYPAKLSGNQIHQGAKLVALADTYAAMITPRAYRKPIMAHQALKDVFTKRGKAIDDHLAQMLIREVGIYPPGSFVKLANGDTALVVKRAIMKKNRDSTAPSVCSIIGPRGGYIENISVRDTNIDMFKITGMCQPELTEKIDYSKIWK